jgi:hypothetical protein
LVQYFYSTNVVLNEEKHPYDYFNYRDTDHRLVVKMPYQDVNSVPYFSLDNVIRGLGFKVVWLLRDGRDVICSKSNGDYHCSPQRWIDANMEFLQNWDNRRIIIVRYEQLVTRTESVMDMLKDFLVSDYQKDFHDFYKAMTDTPMNAGITPRPIDSNSVGNYKNHPERLKEVHDNTEFLKLLQIFGYAD